MVVIWLYFGCSCSLKCLYNCAKTYSFSDNYEIPTNCELIDDSSCQFRVTFYYDRRIYEVSFNDHLSTSSSYEKITIKPASNSFDYRVARYCRTNDTCANGIAIEKIAALRQRSYNVNAIITEIGLAISQNPAPQVLTCYVSKVETKVCNRLITQVESICKIQYDVMKNYTVSQTCQQLSDSSYLDLYESDNSATLTIACNGHQCNNQTTLDAAREILRKYNITDASGRIYSHAVAFRGSFILMSTILLITSIRLFFV